MIYGRLKAFLVAQFDIVTSDETKQLHWLQVCGQPRLKILKRLWGIGEGASWRASICFRNSML